MNGHFHLCQMLDKLAANEETCCRGRLLASSRTALGGVFQPLLLGRPTPGKGGGRPEAEDGAVLGSDPRGLVSPEDGAPKVHTQAFPDAIL